MILHVRANGSSKKAGLLKFAHKTIPCILGRGGIRSSKFEGDGATPAGCFEILYGFYRADRIRPVSTRIKMHPIKQNHGWCDDPCSPSYNRFVTLPTRWRHEKLWRDDHLYDICLVLNHNIHPRRQNRGSAIFFHLKPNDNKRTEGCIAISENQMRKILGRCDGQGKVVICQ